MKPILSYMGGKQKICKEIISFFPEHKIYVEPFFGGGSVFFEKNPSKVEIINDLSSNLFILYKVAREKPDELLHYMNYTLYDQATWKYARDTLKNEESDELKIAWATFVLFQISFGKKGDSFGYGSSDPLQKFFYNRINILPELFVRLKDAQIFNEDGLKTISRFDSQDTLVYCDPPYPGTVQGKYENSGKYQCEELQKLFELAESSKSSFIISSYENAVTKAVDQSKWLRHEINVKTTIAREKDRDYRQTELVFIKLNRNHKEQSIINPQTDIFS